jgi:hypothetical protein
MDEDLVSLLVRLFYGGFGRAFSLAASQQGHIVRHTDAFASQIAWAVVKDQVVL